MRNTKMIMAGLALFAALFVIGELFFVPKAYVNSALVQALQAPSVFFRSLGTTSKILSQLKQLALENQSLRAEIEMLKSRPGIVREGRTLYMRAPVYSLYPLNNSGVAVIGAGSEEGVKEGMLAVAAPGVFVGEVIKTYSHQSEIRTVYDLGWELPVKIGPDKVDSLLIGGHDPRLTLISKKKNASADMQVFLATKKYTYGLLVGSLGNPADSENNLFQEAPLMLPYAAGELDEVYVTLTE